MDSLEKIADPSPGPKTYNPDWSRDETVLLMDLYLSAPRAEKGHPEVVALSVILRAVGRREGRAVLSSFRNPAGIAMRLRNFAKQDPNNAAGRNAGLRPGGAVDRLVWDEFAVEHAALASEVARIRHSISADAWSPTIRSSWGPMPTFGTRSANIADGATGVYLLLIDGPLELLAPMAIPRVGFHLVKLGRTVDLERRIAELSCGIPPGALIQYIPIGMRVFSSGGEAHRFERALLNLCDREGWSLGGEFAYAPLIDLKSALADKKYKPAQSNE